MTDAAEPSIEPAEPTIPQLLLALQAVDTEADQLGHRRAKSPLRDDFATASAQLTAWERQRQASGARIDELAAVIEESEAKGVEMREHRARLEQ